MWCFTSIVRCLLPLTLVCVFLLLLVGSRAARLDTVKSASVAHIRAYMRAYTHSIGEDLNRMGGVD